MAKNELKNEIIWVITDKKSLESETHQVRFSDNETGKDLWWEQIEYLVGNYSKHGKTVHLEFKPRNICTLTVWT